MQDDLARLRQDHPTWRFGTVWASAASGPDKRRLYAARNGVMLSAWNAAELAADIRREEAEQARNPPPGRA
jgi:alkanesulfonate monooxygenase SsuD/methylene tetrahydromethanopterin reductase-like flavin-dependent oxidoreductase (luciferase family)